MTFRHSRNCSNFEILTFIFKSQRLKRLLLLFFSKIFNQKGSFGVVYEITNRETDEKFAIKIINKEKVGVGKYAVSFENEVSIMKSVIHPNLIKLEEVFESKKVRLYLLVIKSIY